MILYIIAACEIGFWVLLGAGMVSRYLLGWRKVGAAFLILVPISELVLLVATIVDLKSGATANFTHGLAAAYIGFSVAFGHSMIRWADARFAHRFAGGPPPEPRPKYGHARTAYEWREFGKGAVMWAVACGLLVGAIVLVGDPIRTEALHGWIARLSAVLGIWFVFWPLWVTIWPLRDPGVEGASR